MDYKEIREKQHAILENHGIFELRAIGRYFGVPSPTTKKREELVDVILDCLQKFPNGRPPHISVGRPHKELNNIIRIVDELKMDNFTNETENIFSRNINFASSGNFKGFVDEPIHVSGVVIQNGRIFLDNKTKALIEIGSSVEYNFVLGDYVLGVANKDSRGKLICDKIIKINGEDAEKYIEPRIIISDEILPNKVFDFDKFKIVEGGNNLINYKFTFLNRKKFIETLNSYSEKYVVLALGANLSKEDILVFENLNYNVRRFTTSMIDEPGLTYIQLVSALSHCERANKIGKNVILFIYDIVRVIKNLELARDSENNIDVEKVIKRLQTVARAVEKGNNLTIINTYEDIDMKNSLFVDMIYKTSNR